jgi:hypothetical protein
MKTEEETLARPRRKSTFVPKEKGVKQPFLRENEGKDGGDFLIQRSLFEVDSQTSEILARGCALQPTAEKNSTTRKPTNRIMLAGLL